MSNLPELRIKELSDEVSLVVLECLNALDTRGHKILMEEFYSDERKMLYFKSLMTRSIILYEWMGDDVPKIYLLARLFQSIQDKKLFTICQKLEFRTNRMLLSRASTYDKWQEIFR